MEGSTKSARSNGWCNGAYEGAEGTAISVFDTGDGNVIPPTARVRFLKPLDPAVDIHVIPVAFLAPIQPRAVGERALIVSGEHAGMVALLMEDVGGGWFVSAAHDFFEIEHGRMVRVLDVSTTEQS